MGNEEIGGVSDLRSSVLCGLGNCAMNESSGVGMFAPYGFTLTLEDSKWSPEPT
jgi:hypothetical protein